MSTYQKTRFYLKISDDKKLFAEKILNSFEKVGFCRDGYTDTKEQLYEFYCNKIVTSEEISCGEYWLNSEYEFTTGGEYIFIGESLYSQLNVGVNVSHFSRDHSRIDPFLLSIKTLICLLDPIYCREASEYDLEEFNTYALDIEKNFELKRLIIKNELIDFYNWINYLGPSLVDHYGKEKLLKGPFYKVEELETGGLLILLNPDCFWKDDGKHDYKIEDAINYLGIDTSWKEVAKAKLLKKTNPFTIDEPYIKAEEIEKYLGITNLKGGIIRC